MKSKALLPFVAALLVVPTLLAGCGGKYRGSTVGGGGNSAFAGDYSGTFSGNNGQDPGQITLSVEDDGKISGNVVVPTLVNPASPTSDTTEVTVNFTGTVTNSGTVANEGTFNGHSTSITATNPATVGLPTSVTFSGIITRTSTGVSGSITRTANGGTSETEPFTASLNQPE